MKRIGKLKNRKNRRRIVTALTIMTLLLGVTGCGSSDTAKENSSESISVEEQAEELNGNEGASSEIVTEASSETKDEANSETDSETNSETNAEQGSSIEIPTGHVANKLVVAYGDTTGTGLCTGLLGIARDRGYIEEELSKINVTYEDMPMVGMGPAINEAFAAGSIDIGSMGDVIAVTGKSNGVDTKLISWGRGNSASSIILAPGLENEIKSIEDLKGKKIQAYEGTFMYRDLIEYLKLGGLTIDDIELVNTNATEAISMLLTGSIDASVNSGYPINAALDGGATVLVDGRDEEYKHLATNGFSMVRADFEKENPDIVYAYVKALARAYKDVIEDPEVYFRQYEEAGGDIKVLDYSNPEHKINDTLVPTKVEKDSESDLIKFMLETGLIENDVDLEAWSETSKYGYKAFEELGIEIPE